MEIIYSKKKDENERREMLQSRIMNRGLELESLDPIKRDLLGLAQHFPITDKQKLIDQIIKNTKSF